MDKENVAAAEPKSNEQRRDLATSAYAVERGGYVPPPRDGRYLSG